MGRDDEEVERAAWTLAQEQGGSVPQDVVLGKLLAEGVPKRRTRAVLANARTLCLGAVYAPTYVDDDGVLVPGRRGVVGWYVATWDRVIEVVRDAIDATDDGRLPEHAVRVALARAKIPAVAVGQLSGLGFEGTTVRYGGLAGEEVRWAWTADGTSSAEG